MKKNRRDSDRTSCFYNQRLREWAAAVTQPDAEFVAVTEPEPVAIAVAVSECIAESKPVTVSEPKSVADAGGLLSADTGCTPDLSGRGQ